MKSGIQYDTLGVGAILWLSVQFETLHLPGCSNFMVEFRTSLGKKINNHKTCWLSNNFKPPKAIRKQHDGNSNLVLLQQTGFPQIEQSDTSDSSEGPANFKAEFQQLRSLKSHILKIGVTNIWVTNFIVKAIMVTKVKDLINAWTLVAMINLNSFM